MMLGYIRAFKTDSYFQNRFFGIHKFQNLVPGFKTGFLMRLNVDLYNIYVYRFLLKEDPHRTNYGMNDPRNDPLNGAIRIFNEFSDLFEFGGSKDGFRVWIKERMSQSTCVYCPRP
jgi:hypothetical protein